MKASGLLMIVAMALPCAGCAAAVSEAPDTDEAIGEASDEITTGEACRASCATSYSAACLRVSMLCAGVTTITIGGATVACSAAIPAVCLSSVALASICTDKCPK